MNINASKKINILLFIQLLLSTTYSAFATEKSNADLVVHQLKVERMKAPVGVEAAKPRFSWESISKERGMRQSAYQILVASSPENLKQDKADIWNSGKVTSDKQQYIPFNGSKLQSGTPYFWEVKIWDQNGTASAWSTPASWITGVLNPAEWQAKWITFDTAKATAQPIFRKPFTLPKKVKKAVAHVSGLGYYEMYLNGQKVGDHVLDPAQTNYDDYAFYVTYDITRQLQKGNNAVGVMLGDGWYNQHVVWDPAFAYGEPLMLCQIDIEFTDGTKKQVISDKSWQWANGPVLKSNVYAGEVYDARKGLKGWSEPGKPAANWMAVLLAAKHPPQLRAQQLPPIKKMLELPVKKIYNVGNGKYVFDLGQNFAGWTRLKVKAPAGTHLKIRMAEEVDKSGNLDMTSTGVIHTKVEQKEEYICSGKGVEIWEPRFTYHGFRYAEVSGLPTEPDAGTLTGIVVYSAVEDAGKFACSEEQMNRLHDMSKWTLISNLHGFPTDCPQREKCGWLGDAHAIAPMSIYNYNSETFWEKYIHDIKSTARNEVSTIFHVKKNVEFRHGIKPAGIPWMVAPGKRLPGVASVDWGTAYVQLPWYVYLYYGNTDVLETFYPDMKQWVEYSRTLTKDNIIYEGLGDWCPPGGNEKMECPVEVSSTAFHYFDLSIMAQVAGILGKTGDQKVFKDQQEKVKAAFINKFFDAKHNTYGSQTADAMALDMGLVPPGKEKAVSDAIAANIKNEYNGFMHAGIFGIQRVFNMLSQYGNEQTAYQVMTKKGNNSFEYMWNGYDATTLWEVLPINNIWDNTNTGSRNHPMQGSFDQWFYAGVLGIKPEAKEAGFKRIMLKPELTTQLSWAKGSYLSGYGPIGSDWRTKGNIFEWDVTVPANTTAVLYIPARTASTIKESGKEIKDAPGVKFIRMEGNRAVIEVGSGDYRFAAAP